MGSRSGGARPKECQLKEQSKLSSTSSGKHCVKKVRIDKKNVETDSDSDSDNSTPDVHTLHTSDVIQKWVDARLHELEMSQDQTGTGVASKLKSKRGTG